jgi:protein NrfD
MKHNDDVWGWMLATDFFFAGMGGGMLVVSGLVHFIWGGQRISILSAFAAPLFVAMGAGLLVLELGRPFQGWRVFLKPNAILTIGAWNMLLAIGFGFCYASFFVPGLPWQNWIMVQKVLAGLGALTGLVVATYPGVLLGRHKSRPFWTGPGMVVLFLISSLVTGFAAQHLLSMIAPPAEATLVNYLPMGVAVLLTFQIIIWFGYLFIKQTGTTEREGKTAQRWTNGDLSRLFWGGFAFLGTLLPLVLVLTDRLWVSIIGDILVVAGGALMRWMVIHSGDQRTWLPGESKYRGRLPVGNELFIKSWNK